MPDSKKEQTMSQEPEVVKSIGFMLDVKCFFHSGDEIEGGKKFIKIEQDLDGIAVQHEGTGCMCGNFPPIFIEWYDGKPRILIWADINEEDPTHVIDMSGALESNRKEQNV